MARSPFIVATVVAALVVAPPSPSEAQEKPQAQVTFQLAHPDYLDEFFEAEIESIQTRAAQLLASFLNKRIGFIDFTTAADVGADHVLRVSLDSADPGARLPIEMGLHFVLEGPDVGEALRSYWRLSSVDVSGPIPQADVLLTQVGLLLNSNVADPRGLVREVLSLVRIAGECELKTDHPEGWILPFSLAEFCIDRGTRLFIRHGVQAGEVDRDVTLEVEASGSVTEPGPLLGHAFCEATTEEGALKLEELQTGTVVTKGIYVIEYDPPDDGCSPSLESPTTVTFGSVEP